MTDVRTIRLATGVVALTGTLWGLYWLPVRALSEGGLPGAWGTALIAGAAALLLAPAAVAARARLAGADPVALASVALGGAAFALYSIGLVYGRVAIVILLYFLTPVWSTLIGHYVMGWYTPRRRIAAIVLGLAGLAAMLGAGGELPVPRGIGEWLALLAGVLWSIATTGMRTRSGLPPVPAAFVFALGAAATALALAPPLAPWPGAPGTAALSLAFGAGGLWWGVTVSALMWAAVRLEPARVGILLMTEVAVGAASAALLAGEILGLFELAGGALVLAAGVLETWPVRAAPAGA